MPVMGQGHGSRPKKPCNINCVMASWPSWVFTTTLSRPGPRHAQLSCPLSSLIRVQAMTPHDGLRNADGIGTNCRHGGHDRGHDSHDGLPDDASSTWRPKAAERSTLMR